MHECLEEAGGVCKVEGLVLVHVLAPHTYDNGDQTQYLDHTFRCRYVSGEAHVADDESTDVRWWPIDGLPEMPDDLAERIMVAARWQGGPARI